MSRERNFNVNMAKMNPGGKSREKKKNTGGLPGIAAAAVLLLISALPDLGGEALSVVLILVLITAAIAFGAYVLARNYKKSAGSTAQAAEALRRQLGRISFTEKEEELSPSKNRQPRSYDPEQARQREMQRRMQQLDSFLKNGIIEREEYNILKDRYSKSSVIQ